MFAHHLPSRGPHPDASRVRDPAYWAGLHPAGGTRATSTSVSAAVVPASCADGPDVHLCERGHASSPGAWDAATVAEVMACVLAVHRAGWPGVTALLFDRAWEALAQPALRDVVSGLLGAPARMRPRFWVHHVPAVMGARGWPPHVDYAEREQATPSKLTCWLALTPARVDNGCIHVVPRGVAPELVRSIGASRTVALDDAMELLHHARALPAEPGTLLAWRPGVLHWGGVSSGESGTPRWALSTEWTTAQDAGDPPLPAGLVPGFEQRLRLVGHSMAVFADAAREPLAHRLASLFPTT